MTEESAFAVQKRGGRWCVIHAESGIMHERNFAHKGMAKLFGMELTDEGYVPDGADKIKDILAEEVEKTRQRVEANTRMEEKKALEVNESEYSETKPKKRRKRRKKK